MQRWPLLVFSIQTRFTMNKLDVVRSFLTDLIRPIVVDAVKSAIPEAPQINRSKYLTVAEIQSEFGVSETWVYRRFYEGSLKKIKMKGRTLVLRTELEAKMQTEHLAGVSQSKTIKHIAACGA